MNNATIQRQLEEVLSPFKLKQKFNTKYVRVIMITIGAEMGYIFPISIFGICAFIGHLNTLLLFNPH